jgi:histone-lysine N-methyltransferase SETD7
MIALRLCCLIYSRDKKKKKKLSRVTVELEGGAGRFEGRVDPVTGSKTGRGRFLFSDDSVLSGTFFDDELQGDGVLETAEGLTIAGRFVNGEMVFGTEVDGDGEVVFRGEYRDGQRSGAGELFYSDGSSLAGRWVDGQPHGHCVFTFQRHHFPELVLVGEWVEGKLKRGKHFKVDADGRGLEEAALKSLLRSNRSGAVVTRDPATRTRISSSPLLPDGYETELAYVSQSTIPGSGEGLFAARAIPAGCVIAFYSGVRVTQREVDQRDWAENSNTITLTEHDDGDGVVIDVPAPFHSCHRYVASLGHKVNHHQGRINCKYDVFLEHPRFGHIKCVRTVKPVEKGDEFLVYYGYDKDGPDGAPDWY